MTGVPGPRLGVVLPTRGILLGSAGNPDTSRVLSFARQAEEAGLDSVWAGDSLIAKPRLEPLSTLAAVASSTSRVGLGTAVLLAPLRQPVLLAQTAATVDALSGGRLTLAMGVGGVFNEAQRKEWDAAGVPASERGARMTELVQLCRSLWTQDSVTFRGRYSTLDDVSLGLRSPQPKGIPVLLACHYRTGSDAQYRRAARFADGVIGITDSPGEYRQVLQRVRRFAREAQREPHSLRTAFYMTVNIGNDPAAAAREADGFITRYYGVNVWKDRWGPFGPPEAVAQRILDYHLAGAREVVVRFASLTPEAQLGAFVKDVVPAVRRSIPSQPGL